MRRSSSDRCRMKIDISAATSASGPLPVVRGERVEREDVDAERRRRLDDLADAPRALAVAGHARLAARSRPAAVPVHDDGDVHHASRRVRAANTAPQSTRAVACISTNSVTMAPMVTVRPV